MKQGKLPWFHWFQKPVPELLLWAIWETSIQRLIPSPNHPLSSSAHPYTTRIDFPFGRAEIIKVLEEYNMTHCWTRNIPILIDFRLTANLASLFGTIPSAPLLNCSFNVQLKIYFVQKKTCLIWQEEELDTCIHHPVWTHLPWIYTVTKFVTFMLESQFCH